MNEEIKQEPTEDSKEDFSKRAKEYLERSKELQKELQLEERPIITQYGPDIQLLDTKEKTKEEKIIKV